MDFIYTNNFSLSKEICEQIIYYYNRDKDLGYDGITANGYNPNVKNTRDLNISLLIYNDDIWKNIHEILYKELYVNLKNYFNKLNKEDYNKYHQQDYPKFKIIDSNTLKAETFQIQKYEPNQGKYIYHNDFQVDLKMKRYRVITYLWYLNDVEEGGETELLGSIKIKPEVGKLLLFPCSWTYPHCANIPISNEKYIITGWLYVDIL